MGAVEESNYFIKKEFLLPENCLTLRDCEYHLVFIWRLLAAALSQAMLAMALKPEEYKRSVSFKAEDICVKSISMGDSRYRRCRTEWMTLFV